MNIVIEIPEQRYVAYENDTVHTFAERAILQGTPLEQIFDEIKKEIEALPKTYPFTNHIDTYVKEDDVKKIIDKYMTGSEKGV